MTTSTEINRKVVAISGAFVNDKSKGMCCFMLLLTMNSIDKRKKHWILVCYGLKTQEKGWWKTTIINNLM